MSIITHLKSLQALEMAIQEGSLKSAADRLRITPAAVGQRIRALEDYLGMDLLTRGRSGLKPTAQLAPTVDDLHTAFSALERVTESLDFQKVSEIHINADLDWAELWLTPRLSQFREEHPNILFCINGVGDIPMRLGAPDIRISNGAGKGEPLFKDLLVPITGPDNLRRLYECDDELSMEGMPLLHLQEQRDHDEVPGWVEWFEEYGQRVTGKNRGVHYKNVRIALDAARQNVGFLVCGLSLVMSDLEANNIILPFPTAQHLLSPYPYRLHVRHDSAKRPQVQKFIAWLRHSVNETEQQMQEMIGQPDLVIAE